jgi:hypothetical protein
MRSYLERENIDITNMSPRNLLLTLEMLVQIRQIRTLSDSKIAREDDLEGDITQVKEAILARMK